MDKELRVHLELGETSLWIYSLAEEAETVEEVERLTATLRAELTRFLQDSTQPVPIAAREALAALEARHDALG